MNSNAMSTAAAKYNIKITQHNSWSIILKARDFEKKNELQKAYNEYDKGIPELESYTLKITSKSLKDSWKEEIDSLRHKQQRLKRTMDEQAQADIRKKNKDANVKSRNKTIPLEDEPGYQLILKAQSFEKSKKLGYSNYILSKRNK